MNKNYDVPSINIISFDSEIQSAGGSVVIQFPWTDENESDFFN